MLRIVMLAAAAVLGFTGTASAQYAWKPDKPITIVVPWAAGGSTDQVMRVTAAEIEKALGQKVVVDQSAGRVRLDRHQERARGAEGRLHLDLGRRQGHRHLHRQRPARHQDRRLAALSRVANVSVLGVNPNSPYKTAADLVAAMKAKPGQVTVATAGINSSGHAAIETFTRALGADLQARHL